MKLRTVTLTILLAALVFTCKSDDDGDDIIDVEVRDRTEVYEEDKAAIDVYLDTHFYNYDEFDFENPYSEANDSFQVVFDTIAGENSDKIPLSQRPELISKQVADSEEEDLIYTMYYLMVREGEGEVIHFTDRAHVQYSGTLLDGTIFDSTITPVGLSLSSIGGEYGVVDGFKEGVIEFKTSTSNSENGDGTVTYHKHGIGATIFPSGLGYFSASTTKIPQYSPLIFTLRTPGVTYLDHDNDGVYSYLEDINNNGDVYDDDTDGDGIYDVLDLDDDGDGVFTIWEDLDEDGDPTNDIGANGIPNYLDPTETASTQDED
ncbi:FKBP-type peptidylprolyl isomerase [Formosa agariphila KMM 3901]|uniref:Peptidyl-prolyl cis-trans isomerase n=1 Tax=Formosa agariphila (strain DSM 15362 / KCTC 12365 / LMG 23005 / KMM 3901 / M-2Alg 35-1) TaxID=1347342 RepID=T2KJK1_FORAG|nr:FKBP-type peptidyl-prolyl cis-trans isomerase [Formosa agariphila]CDF78601.1 FKBP-type peptidylprolyl isomerase [Formosa agariphila KMM 3901]